MLDEDHMNEAGPTCSNESFAVALDSIRLRGDGIPPLSTLIKMVVP